MVEFVRMEASDSYAWYIDADQGKSILAMRRCKRRFRGDIAEDIVQ